MQGQKSLRSALSLNMLPQLREAVQSCRGCDLYKRATQAVFGEGPQTSSIVFIGEQPGDEEDREGKPFVGPAGRLFDWALHDAGIDRSAVYVTNAVKHFTFEERGKRRIHKKPNGTELKACRPWLEAEVALMKPSINRLSGRDGGAIGLRTRTAGHQRERAFCRTSMGAPRHLYDPYLRHSARTNGRTASY